MAEILDSQRIKEELPTHEEIEQRAYELYLESGSDGQSIEHWLMAEEELLQKQRNRRGALASPTPAKRTASTSRGN
jgi:hypothetical protein